ncbi:helix-turn-helix transcriptional regulator [Ancylobacter lacus]|nr:helix-turn-helix transcriptional regulator [Ancylobacter lacus]
MRLFWRRGFAETSISYLTEAMGIGKKSLYAAFGSKEDAFAERTAQATAAALLLSGSVLRPLSWDGNAPSSLLSQANCDDPESGRPFGRGNPTSGAVACYIHRTARLISSMSMGDRS